MPDTSPSPVVGDKAELTLKNGRKVLTEWSGEHWCQINLPNCWWPVDYVTAVRPLRLVDADAVVLNLPRSWTANRLRVRADFLMSSHYLDTSTLLYEIADQVEARDAAAVVPDEGGGGRVVTAAGDQPAIADLLLAAWNSVRDDDPTAAAQRMSLRASVADQPELLALLPPDPDHLAPLVPDGPGWVEAVERAARASYSAGWQFEISDEAWMDEWMSVIRATELRSADAALRAALGGGSVGS